MKKAKVILTIISCLAIGGGILAFEAGRVPNIFYKAGPDGRCTVTTLLFYTTLPVLGDPGFVYCGYATVATATTCRCLTLYRAN